MSKIRKPVLSKKLKTKLGTLIWKYWDMLETNQARKVPSLINGLIISGGVDDPHKEELKKLKERAITIANEK